MDFFDKLGANLTNAGRVVSQKTRNFNETNSLKRELANEKRNIQRKYTEIGQLYFEKFNNDPGCDFFSEVDEILTSQRRIESLEAEIAEVQNRQPELVTVPERSHTAPNTMQPSAMVCMQCGQTYEPKQAYCSSCGTKLTPQYPTGAAASAAAPITPQTFSAPETPYSRAVPNQEKPATVTPNPMQTGNTAPVKTDLTKPAPKEEAPAAPADVKPVTEGRFCTECGAKAAEDSVFCAHCGNRLS